MKTFSADLLASYSKRVSTIANCMKIIRLDGTTYTFTNLDKDLTIDGEVYKSSYAFNPTAYSSALGLQIENMEVEGAVDSLNIDDFDIIKNLFYGAEVWSFSVDYKNIAAGKDKILYGTIGEIELTDKVFKFEIRGMSKRYENLYSSYYGKICRARLGDSRCGVDISAFKLAGKVDNASENSSLYANYFKFYFTITRSYSELKVYDILLYDAYNNIIPVEEVSLTSTDDCKCSDNSGGNTANILDNSTSTHICINTIGTSYNPTAIIYKLSTRTHISKITFRDEPTWNSGNKIEQVKVSTSLNGYTWSDEVDVYDDSFRVGNLVTLNLSSMLASNGTNRYRFISNDVRNSGKENNYYQYGNITWLSGSNIGLQTEIISSDTSGNIELALPTVYDIEDGDTFEISPGCNHLLYGSDGKISSGHCKSRYNNVINFRGEPYLPNEDVILSGYIAVQKSREASEDVDMVLLEPVDE